MVTGTRGAVDPRLAAAFADVLEYPRGPLGGAARACEELAARRSAEAAALLAGFRAFAERATLGELQEAYTAAFDLDSLSDLEPTCYPYVGHHLFEKENSKRSAFLVGLSERYREHGFAVEGELPDHLVVMLRFFAVCDDDGLVGELLEEALGPALARMARGNETGGPAGGRERYLQVLRALRLTLEAGAGERG